MSEMHGEIYGATLLSSLFLFLIYPISSIVKRIEMFCIYFYVEIW